MSVSEQLGINPPLTQQQKSADIKYQDKKWKITFRPGILERTCLVEYA